MKVLLVDDEGGLRMTLAANLELEGFEVVEAPDALTALRLAQEQPFDLVLSDIRMPGLSGVELYRRFRALHPGVPFLLMTAFTLEALVEEALSEGVFTVLSKPFSIESAVATLSSAVHRPIVLVVDGPPADAESVALALRSAGVRAQAADESRAQEVLGRELVDVCVVGLSDIDAGPSLLRRLQAERPALTLIALLAGELPERSREAASEAFACLRKPVSRRELISTIARARSADRRSPAAKRSH